MSLLPIDPTQQSNMAPAISADLLNLLQSQFDSSFKDLGTASGRRLKVRKSDFLIQDGQNLEVVAAHEMYAVLLGSAPCNHAVWYEQQYAPGQEPAAPDLVWNMETPDTYPDALPAQFRQKIVVQGTEKWAYQINRRTVWAQFKKGADGKYFLDLQNPFILDLTSMSLYGKNDPTSKTYKWANIKAFCASRSTTTYTVLPYMFLTQIILDPLVSVSGVVSFKPFTDENDNVIFLDAETMGNVANTVLSKTVQDLTVVREKLTYKGAAPVIYKNPVQQAPVQVTPSQPIQPVHQSAVQPANVQQNNVQAQSHQTPVQTQQVELVQNIPSPQVQPVQQAPVQQAPVQANDLLSQAQNLLQNGQSSSIGNTISAMQAQLNN